MRSISKVEIYLEDLDTHRQDVVTLTNWTALDAPLRLFLMMGDKYPCNVFASPRVADYLSRVMGDTYSVRAIQGPSLRDLLREVIDDSAVDS